MTRIEPRDARTGVALLALLILVMVASGVWQLSTTRASLRTQVMEESLLAAQLASEVIGQDVRADLQLVAGMAAGPSLPTIAESGDERRARRYLQGLTAGDFALDSLALVDPDGEVIARVPDFDLGGRDLTEQEHFRRALATRTPQISGVFIEGSVPMIAYAAPVLEGGEAVAVLEATQATERFALNASGITLPRQGSLHVFDATGALITGDLGAGAFGDDRSVRAALQGRTGAGEGTLPGTDEAGFISYAPVTEVGWAVLVTYPSGAAWPPFLSIFLGRLVVTSLILTAIAFFVAHLLGQVSRERSYLRAILGSMAEGAVAVDRRGRVDSVNPALEKLSGISEADARGRKVEEVFTLVDERGRPVPVERRPIPTALRQGTAQLMRDYRTFLGTTYGTTVPVHLAAAPVVMADGSQAGVIGIIRDVSYEREVDQLKSSLISTVSHELRTPLTMIQGFSELLLSRDLDAEMSSEALGQIHSAAERLARLIEDLLSVSRIESGRMELRLGDVDARTLIEEVVAPFDAQEERDFLIDVSSEVGVIQADRDRLVQILTNLLSNAVKYSENGTRITIWVRLRDSVVNLGVTDEGVGMTRAELEQLFTKFFRSDHPHVVNAGGTGLGLFIARGLVDLHGGEMEVTSEPGRGSTFSFTLPMDVEWTEKVFKKVDAE